MVFNNSPYMAALMAHLLGGGAGNYGLPFNPPSGHPVGAPLVGFVPPVDSFGMPIFHASPVRPPVSPHPIHPFHYRR